MSIPPLLALLAGRDLSCVTDVQVVENFIADIASEDGALRQYLAHADVAVVLGNTLFVHGAVDAQTMAFVPSHTRFELPQVKQPATFLAVCGQLRLRCAKLPQL